MKKLRIAAAVLSASGVIALAELNVLIGAGLGPEPNDHPDTWSDFLGRHAATMWKCDFACKRKWTIKGMVDLYFLVFIHIQTLKHEVLNAFCVVNEKHLGHILRVSQDWCNHRRGHSDRDHLPPVRDDGEPPVVDLAKTGIVCHGLR